MNRILKATLTILLASTLTACLEDDESNENKAETGSMNGIYSVSASEESGDTQFDFVALIHNGMLRAITSGGKQYSGEINTRDNNTFSTNFAQFGTNSKVEDFIAASGDYTEQEEFTARYERDSGASGAMTAKYNYKATHQPASTQRISGVYASGPNDAITINQNGDIFGTDENGCAYSGEITAPNSQRNIYQTILVIENCGKSNGRYVGLAARGKSDQSDTLLMLVSDKTYGISFQLERQ